VKKRFSYRSTGVSALWRTLAHESGGRLGLLAVLAHKYKYWHRTYAAAELYRGGLPEREDSHC
jgi:hypothetical protein